MAVLRNLIVDTDHQGSATPRSGLLPPPNARGPSRGRRAPTASGGRPLRSRFDTILNPSAALTPSRCPSGRAGSAKDIGPASQGLRSARRTFILPERSPPLSRGRGNSNPRPQSKGASKRSFAEREIPLGLRTALRSRFDIFLNPSAALTPSRCPSGRAGSAKDWGLGPPLGVGAWGLLPHRPLPQDRHILPPYFE